MIFFIIFVQIKYIYVLKSVLTVKNYVNYSFFRYIKHFKIMSEKLLVPDIGDFDEVEVIEILVKQGDQIKINDPVVTIESDKSSVEIPSTISGSIEAVAVKVGDKVSKGDLLLSLISTDQDSLDKPIPKDTESIIKQAEAAMAEKKEENVALQNPAQEKKQSIIQVTNDSDLDPLETTVKLIS